MMLQNKCETTYKATQPTLPFPHSFVGFGEQTEIVSLLFSVNTGYACFYKLCNGVLLIITISAMVQETSSVTANIQVRIKVNFNMLNVYSNVHQTRHHGIRLH
jgi:hypothetical protein